MAWFQIKNNVRVFDYLTYDHVNYKIKYKKLATDLGTKHMISEHITSQIFFKNNKNLLKNTSSFIW